MDQISTNATPSRNPVASRVEPAAAAAVEAATPAVTGDQAKIAPRARTQAGKQAGGKVHQYPVQKVDPSQWGAQLGDAPALESLRKAIASGNTKAMADAFVKAAAAPDVAGKDLMMALATPKAQPLATMLKGDYVVEDLVRQGQAGVDAVASEIARGVKPISGSGHEAAQLESLHAQLVPQATAKLDKAEITATTMLFAAQLIAGRKQIPDSDPRAKRAQAIIDRVAPGQKAFVVESGQTSVVALRGAIMIPTGLLARSKSDDAVALQIATDAAGQKRDFRDLAVLAPLMLAEVKAQEALGETGTEGARHTAAFASAELQAMSSTLNTHFIEDYNQGVAAIAQKGFNPKVALTGLRQLPDDIKGSRGTDSNAQIAEKVARAQGIQLPAPPSAPPPKGYTRYTLREGDTLESIARAQLGDASKWEEIYKANQPLLDSLGTDGVVQLGTQLRIPKH